MKTASLTPPEVFKITIEAGPEAPALPALRRLLKRLGRAYRLRVVTVERVSEEGR